MYSRIRVLLLAGEFENKHMSYMCLKYVVMWLTTKCFMNIAFLISKNESKFVHACMHNLYARTKFINHFVVSRITAQDKITHINT